MWLRPEQHRWSKSAVTSGARDTDTEVVLSDISWHFKLYDIRLDTVLRKPVICVCFWLFITRMDLRSCLAISGMTFSKFCWPNRTWTWRWISPLTILQASVSSEHREGHIQCTGWTHQDRVITIPDPTLDKMCMEVISFSSYILVYLQWPSILQNILLWFGWCTTDYKFTQMPFVDA